MTHSTRELRSDAGPSHLAEASETPSSWVQDLRRGRLAASSVLQKLIVARADIEAQLAERRRTDPFKTCTGHSAFDAAIDRIQARLVELDAAADRIEAQSPVPSISIARDLAARTMATTSNSVAHVAL